MVDELTNRVLESAWHEHTDLHFYPLGEEEGDKSIGVAANAQNLIRLVCQQIEAHIVYREGRQPNYEDLFAALKQVLQDEMGEVVNPLIKKTVDELRQSAASFYLSLSAHVDGNRFASLVDRAVDLIQCVVFHSLRNFTQPVGMSLLTDASKVFAETDIFSLNHDLLIESQFESEGIAYADGFSEPDGDALLFNMSWNQTKTGVRLFKLHGSVDWYLFRFKRRGVDQYGKLRTSPRDSKDSFGNRFDPLDIVPSFLTGTTVKEQVYGYGLYGELFEQFRHRLREHRVLVFCGYGWGDKGLNIRINQWLRDRRENRIIILHGHGKDDVIKKSFWYWRWEDYHREGKVRVIPKWLSEFSIHELQQVVSEELVLPK